MRTCFCGRTARGFAWHDFKNATFERLPPVPACSMACLDIVTRKHGKMQINVDERRAVAAASPAIGAWLEQVGKTDLATMSEAEWLGFLGHVYGSICAETRKIWENEVPF